MAGTNFMRTEKTGASNQLGVVNKQGVILLEPIYDDVSISVISGFIFFGVNGKHGLLDTQTGKIAIEPAYDKLEIDTENQLVICALKQKSDKPFSVYKYGLIDYKGKVAISAQYNEFIKLGKLYFAKKDDGYTLLDKTGKVLQKFDYNYMRFVNNNFIATNKTGRYGVVDIKGNVKLPFTNYNIEPAGEYYYAADNGIYTPENELVIKGNALNITSTNNLPLRKAGIVVLRLGTMEMFRDRYDNSYIPKKN